MRGARAGASASVSRCEWVRASASGCEWVRVGASGASEGIKVSLRNF